MRSVDVYSPAQAAEFCARRRAFLRSAGIGLTVAALAPLIERAPAFAARLANGTNQSLQAASALPTLGTTFTLATWLWIDSYGGGTQLALEYGDVGGAGGFNMFPNPGTGRFAAQYLSDNTQDVSSWTRPSAAAWHHYVLNFSVPVATVILSSVYVDGSSASLTHDTIAANTTGPGSKILYLLSRGNASLWCAGRIAETTLWNTVNLSGANAATLAGGALPTAVQSGSITASWLLCGTASPETPLVGSINMTVNGATNTAQPTSNCAAGTRRNKGRML